MDVGGKPVEASQSQSSFSKPLIIAVIGIVVVAAVGILNFSLDSPLSLGPAKTAPKVAGPSLPAFDVVRVDAKGGTVMAGRAAPNSTVIILDGEAEIGRVTADKNGDWVFTPDQPLAAGTRQLSLRMINAGKTTTSDKVVVMSVPEQGGEVLIVEQARDGGKSRVLQGTGADAGLKTLKVETADYDATGKVALSGKAEPGATVQVYFDNEFLGRAIADDKGYWQIEVAGKAKPGNHTLRADQVGQNDSIIARIEVPFVVDAVKLTGNPGETIVVRGNSLWRIARRTYGDGMFYTTIFEANQGQIKDPNLIYPGQVFKLPQRNGS